MTEDQIISLKEGDYITWKGLVFYKILSKTPLQIDLRPCDQDHDIWRIASYFNSLKSDNWQLLTDDNIAILIAIIFRAEKLIAI